MIFSLTDFLTANTRADTPADAPADASDTAPHAGAYDDEINDESNDARDDDTDDKDRWWFCNAARRHSNTARDEPARSDTDDCDSYDRKRRR
jgi:hypothetical protein